MRTEISSAIANGSLVTGSCSLLASGESLPTAHSSTVVGTTVNLSRIAFVGGHHIATGDKTFNTHQPIWDPRLAWASDFAVWTEASF